MLENDHCSWFLNFALVCSRTAVASDAARRHGVKAIEYVTDKTLYRSGRRDERLPVILRVPHPLSMR